MVIVIRQKTGEDMIEKEKLDAAVRVFTNNPYWKKMYDEAPSENCKEKVSLMFYYSLFSSMPESEKEEYRKYKAEVEDKLELKDWEHLCKYAGNNPWRGRCREMIRKLGGTV